MSGHNAQPVIPIVTTQEAPQCSAAQPIGYEAQVSKFGKENQGTPRAAWQINLAEAVLSSE